MSKPVLICAFPKTGTTWVRWQLANLYWPKKTEEIDFDFVNKCFPTIHSLKEMVLYKHDELDKKCPAVFKSHKLYTEFPGKYIIVIRPPIDVMYSLWHHEVKFNHFKGSYGFFLSDRFYGQGYIDWLTNMKEFIIQHEERQRDKKFLLIKYSDLKYFENLGQIASFIGINSTKQALKNVIINTEFEKMQQIEITKGLGLYANNHPGLFIRNGLKPENKLTGLNKSAVNNMEKITLQYISIVNQTEQSIKKQ